MDAANATDNLETPISTKLESTSLTRTYTLLAGSAIAGLVMPLGLASLLPSVAETVMLGTSLVSSVALATMNKSKYIERASAEQRRIDNLRDAALKKQLVREAIVHDVEEKVDHVIEICTMLAALPAPVRNRQLVELGWKDLIPLFEPPKPPQEKQSPKLVALTAEGSEDNGSELVETIGAYAQCKRQLMMFVGNQGEGKTNACHFALYSWLATATPEDFPIIYVFDPHYGSGRDPRYRSTWLGIPRVTEVPKSVLTVAFHGEPEQLEQWLMPVMRLYRHRKANGIDLINGARPVVVLVDELTNHLNLIDEAKAKAIAKKLAELGTGAPKFGIYFWGIVHDLAQSATQIPRTLYRQCEIVMGAGMVQDHTQVSNSPKAISRHTVEVATVARRNTTPGIPAGYATSLPVPDGFLPPAPLTNQEMELEWLVEQIELNEPDVYKEWDAEFEEDTNHQPEDYWSDEDIDTTPAAPQPQPKPQPQEIKPRDINQGNVAREWFDIMREWFLKANKNVTDDEIKDKWREVTGREEPLSELQIKYLRDRMDRK
jgi:hypothetical protein